MGHKNVGLKIIAIVSIICSAVCPIPPSPETHTMRHGMAAIISAANEVANGAVCYQKCCIKPFLRASSRTNEYKETFDVEKSRRKAIKSRAPNFVFSSLRPASPSFASMRLVFIFVSRIYIWCAEWIFHFDGIVRHWQFPLLLLCLFDQKRFARECAYKSVY